MASPATLAPLLVAVVLPREQQLHFAVLVELVHEHAGSPPLVTAANVGVTAYWGGSMQVP